MVEVCVGKTASPVRTVGNNAPLDGPHNIMPVIPSTQIVSIQYLRAVAALLVVFQHTREQIPLYDDFLTFSAGGSGVDLFFVISGFVMCITATHSTASDFMAKRIIRVVPLYWFFTILLTGLELFVPTLFRTTVVSTNSLL
ncbi:MAG: acyltransferase [Rhodospirillales bacterium]|nr:acyltransferase [Rhodospirillales bacterium]